MTLHAGANEVLGPRTVEPVLVVLAEVLILAIPVTLIGLWFRGRQAKLNAFVVFTSVVAGLVVSYGLGLVHSHPAPYELQPGTVLSGPPVNAFPSQHATVAFGMVWPLYWLGRRRLAVGFVVAAVLIGVGRVATGLHYPVDIVGAVFASGVGFGVIWLGSTDIERWAEFVVATESRVLGYLGELVG